MALRTLAPHDDPLVHELVRRRAAGALFGGTAPLVVGRYELRGVLGAGGTGVVFAAWDPELEREVALKVLRHDRGRGLLTEARALARLAHPHVVTVYDVGEHDGRGFVAMERVEGPTLRTWARGRPVAEVVGAWQDAAHGLEAAHAAGLVHGDIKPDNVLVGADGRVRVVDFGGGGTPGYRAPEQEQGATALPASDQYAVCASLLEAMTGDPEGSVEAVPSRYRSALRRGLSAAPEQRFPSLSTLFGALTEDRLAMRLQTAVHVVLVAFGATALVGTALQMWMFARMMGLLG